MAGTEQLELQELEVKIPADGVFLNGNLTVPTNSEGVVLFAHGSGSSRYSPRNRFVAQAFQDEGLATLLMDLLTSKEEAIDLQTRQLRFDIGLLAGRLTVAIDWLKKNPASKDLTVGCFGASTGAAAALIAAARRPTIVKAVVSRGGRPDLAGEELPLVKAPTLLIVGGLDQVVIELNRQALSRLAAPKQLEIVPGATHLFEEPGKLEDVARLAGNWYKRHLRGE
jgi:putative phosphoribosyl transferase